MATANSGLKTAGANTVEAEAIADETGDINV